MRLRRIGDGDGERSDYKHSKSGDMKVKADTREILVCQICQSL
jgi:hypothetical protein